MKKLALSLFAIVALSLSSHAQTEKGKIMLGGGLTLDSYNSDVSGASEINNFRIEPNIGYFFGNNIALGTGVGYSYTSSNGYKNSAFTVSPFGRYYTTLSESFKFFGQLSVPMAFGSFESPYFNNTLQKGKTTTVGIGLAPGFAFFPTKKIGIEVAVSGFNYNKTTAKDDNGNKLDDRSSKTFGIGANFFTPRLGVQFYF